VALRRHKTDHQDPFGLHPASAALVAATAQVDLSAGSSWKTWKFGNKDWQAESWRLYDIVPEHRKLTNRIGDSLAKARLYVTEVDETGEETGEVTDPRIRQLAAVPLGTGAQRDDCLRLAGVDLAAAGECWIVGEGAAKTPEAAEGTWFVVTGAAFKKVGDTLIVKRPKTRGSGTLTLTDKVDILIRCWRPHPNDNDQADSFARPGIVPLREIELLTKREFAELDSRLTGAGIMFLPEGIDFPRAENDPEGIGGFMAYVQRAAAASMADQSTARALVPIMATVPDGTDLSALKDGLINFWSPLSGEIGGMKKEAIERLASSAEIPAEVLTGIGDANHWTAWLISDEGIRWIGGYLSIVADALTRGFLRLALASMGVANPERYAFAFDLSRLAAKPNRLDDALRLREQNLLSDVETVKAGAFDEEQMPTQQERVIQLLIGAIKTNPDLLADKAIQSALGLPLIMPVTAGESSTPPPGTTDTQPSNDGPPNSGEPPAAPADGEAAAISRELERRLAMATTPALPSREVVFNAACKLLVLRALELAGGRLATPQERRGRWAGIPRHELHHQVGPITPEKAARVTEGAWNHVAVTASDLGVDAPELERLLSGYVAELLTRGMRHHDDLLFAALAVADRGRGLVVA
jgi:hypothetical protein